MGTCTAGSIIINTASAPTHNKQERKSHPCPWVLVVFICVRSSCYFQSVLHHAVCVVVCVAVCARAHVLVC